MSIVPVLLPLSLLTIGGVILQIFLSTRKSKWLGLILPSITLFFSILITIAIIFFMPAGMNINHVEISNVEISQEGESSVTNIPIAENIQINDPITDQPISTNSAFSPIGAAILTFLLMNIPTFMNLIIYSICRYIVRNKIDKHNNIDKMSIQDL